jgi:cytochrome c oxidase subunit 2
VNRVAPAAADPDAGALRGNSRVQTMWIASSTTIVLGLAILGTITLANDTTVPTVAHAEPSTPLEIQVIAQQWYFTYRYPSLGGFESAHLVVPANQEVEFHVTSLDVTHSFWFFAAGVKADAVPLHDNSVDMQPQKIGTYRIECSELCGIWHPGMADSNAQIVSAADFNTWVQQQQQLDAPILKFLPPYSHTYVPAPGAYGS